MVSGRLLAPETVAKLSESGRRSVNADLVLATLRSPEMPIIFGGRFFRAPFRGGSVRLQG